MTQVQPVEFFRDARAAYQQAERAAGGVVERHYRLSGFSLRLCFAAPALVSRLAPALEHLAVSPNGRPPDLTVHLWDSTSTATRMARRPWQADDLIARGDVRSFRDKTILTALTADVGALSILNLAENVGLFWIRNAADLPTYERGAPLRAILHWWMRQRSRHLVHAAAVGVQGKGALIVGRGGSGKSTTALTCLTHGWDYASDDYCLVSCIDSPRAESLYNTAKLNADHLRNLPQLLPAISNREELGSEKALLYLHQYHPARLTAGFDLKAILLPRVTGKPATAVQAATPAAGLRALAPSSLFQLPGSGQDEFFALSRLVQAVPCYHLELGTRLDQTPPVIEEVLNR